uniref:(California timema) hypothetical protein n=1 Tax=Timema californicum TaxID=61474 RepID=A0A7R9J1H5_TIMCA|nr:unnamed protein product [Timema californicum]
MGSVRGEDVPYVLGLPLVGGQPFFPHNYTRQDGGVARLLIHYLANFARSGKILEALWIKHATFDYVFRNCVTTRPQREPNSPNNGWSKPSAAPSEDQDINTQHPPFWDTYDSINQFYMELGTKARMHNHYRGHKMSLWLNLIPQFHRPGGDDLNMRHHHFLEEGAQFYEGQVRPQTQQRPNIVYTPPITPTTTTTPFTSSPTTRIPSSPVVSHETASTTTECPPNSTSGGAPRPPSNSNNNNLLRRLASSHYQSYTTALTITIAVGCFLLLLNILIFAGIYHQRDRSEGAGHFGDKKKEELVEAGSCSSSSGDVHHFEGKHPLVDHISLSSSQQHIHPSASGAMVDLPLQEFKCSPTSGAKSRLNCPSGVATLQQPPSYAPNKEEPPVPQTQQPTNLTSPSIPEPPPPPKTQPPSQCNQVSGGGILRQQGCPQTPGMMKKRVQIQEISV